MMMTRIVKLHQTNGRSSQILILRSLY